MKALDYYGKELKVGDICICVEREYTCFCTAKIISIGKKCVVLEKQRTREEDLNESQWKYDYRLRLNRYPQDCILYEQPAPF